MAMIAGIISGIASIMGGIAAAKQAEYQAQVAKNNAKIAAQNAQYALDAGMREQEAFKMKASDMISTQEAIQAASGVDVNVGSPLLVRAGARSMEALDVETLKNNAERKSADYRAQRMNFLAQSDLYRMEANNAMMQGMLGGIGSVLGSFSSVSPKWDSWRSPAPLAPAASSAAPSYPQPGLSSPLVPRAPTPLSPAAPAWIF